jgi:uncharacterized membrane protein
MTSCIGAAAAFQPAQQAPGVEWLREGLSQPGPPPAAFSAADVEREVQRAEMDRIGSLPVSCHGRRHPGVLYHVRKLPIDGATLAAATALNNAGLVVGYREIGAVVRPTLWAGTTPYDLGTPAGEGGEAHGIGDSGVVVGMVGSSAPADGFVAALWYRGVRHLLRSPDPANPYPFTVAVALNRQGTIIGNHHTLATDDDRPVVWRRGVPRFLPALLSIAFANDINDAGYVVGSSDYPGGILRQRAVLWTPEGRIRALDGLGGLDSRAYGINNKGKIVGVADRAPDGASQPVLWYRGRVTVLPTRSSVGGIARAINEHDQVVGFQGAGLATSYRAVTWFGTAAYQLDTLLDDESRGIVINDAQDINDKGQIIATTILSSGVGQPLLLTPRPCYHR